MTRSITYGDLGRYLDDSRKAYPKETYLRQMYTAWKRFVKEFPELKDTAITEEDTDKAIRRLPEVATDLQPSTLNNYARSLPAGIDRYLGYIEQTGNTQFVSSDAQAVPIDEGGALTYGHLLDYVTAYREENWDNSTAKKWYGACNAVAARIHDLDQRDISPEETETILAEFSAAVEASKKDRLTRRTVASYRTSFRQAVREYCERVGLPYAQIDRHELRLRTLVGQRRAKVGEPTAPAPKREAEADVEADVDVETPSDAEQAVVVAEAVIVDPHSLPAGFADYTFLLRPHVSISVPLPTDLTAAEAERLAQWIGSFVIEP